MADIPGGYPTSSIDDIPIENEFPPDNDVPPDDDVSMEDESEPREIPEPSPARLERPVNEAKRQAVATPAILKLEQAKNDNRVHEERAKKAIREKNDARKQLEEAQQAIAALTQQFKEYEANVQNNWTGAQDQWRTEQVALMKAKTDEQLEIWRQELAQGQQHIHNEFNQKLERQKIAHQDQLQEQRGARRPENEQNQFPDGAPSYTPEYVSPATRETRQVAAIIRDGPADAVTSFAQRFPSPGPTPGPSDNGPQQATEGPASLVNLNDPALMAVLKNLVTDVAKTTYGGVVKASSPGKKKKKTQRKRGISAELNEARQAQQLLLTSEQDERWKALVRDLWRRWFTLNRAKDWFNYQSLDEGTSLQCRAGLIQPEGPLSKLYMGSCWATCLWNRMVLEKCVEHLLTVRSADPQHCGVPDVSKLYLVALFYGSLKEAQTTWSRHQPKGGETWEEAGARADKEDEKRRTKNVGNARKRTKTTRRHDGCLKMAALAECKGDHASAKIWRWLAEQIVDELDVAGASSEEDEFAEVHYGSHTVVTTLHSVLICPWRPKKVNEYFQLIDQAIDAMNHKRTGRRTRVPSSKVSETWAPIRMPRALYDTAWLAAQKVFNPSVEDDLEINEEKELELMDLSFA
ncbi:hypothetical protein C8R46DRAFT_1036414 [Mycena filopes]|nr:hypothetical protein C8R46DRAFT_1036414 [Mycena filopes]